MIRVSTPQGQPARPHPLLFAPCTCRAFPGALCLACRRWLGHYRMVIGRRSAWRAQR